MTRRRANWIEQTNPLRWLTPAKAVALLEALDRGEHTEPQWAFNAIEQADPDLIAIIERCIAPLIGMDWDIKTPLCSSGALSPEPAAANLRNAYERIQNMRAAVEHLAIARFRGFSILQCQDDAGAPSAPGQATRLAPINHWNVVRDGRAGAWKWNPDAKVTSFDYLPEDATLDPVRDHLIIRERARPVDRIALVKFIRSNFSQKAWADFVETAARQGVAIIEPANVDAGARADYEAAAQAFSEGNSASMPNGAQVVFANAQRGALPFESHMRYLREQLVMAGTGGMLTMIANPTGIGQGATDAQEAAFNQIAAREAADISEALQRGFDRHVLGPAAGPRPPYFQIAPSDDLDPTAILDDAGKAKLAGLNVDAVEISEKTGYKLTAAPAPDPAQAPGRSPFAFNADPAAAAGSPAVVRAPRAAKAGPQDAITDLAESARRRIAAAHLEAFKPIAARLQALYDRAEALPDAAPIPADLLADVRAFVEQDLPELFKLTQAGDREQEAWLALIAKAFAGGTQEATP